MNVLKKLKNEIVTVITPNGELIGRLNSFDSTTIVLTNPRLFVNIDGNGGFLPGACVTGEENPDSMVIFMAGNSIVKSHPSIAASWQQQTSGIMINPQEQGIYAP